MQLADDAVKHLRRVLRMDWNERLLALDGAGRIFDATLEEEPDGAAVRLNELVRVEPQPLLLELVIALPKNATMDWVVEKAVECGVTSIVPVVSSRSVVRPSHGDEQKYVRRWQSIMDGALEQSERLWRPLIHAPVAWREFAGASSPQSVRALLFASELRAESRSEAEDLRVTLEKLRQSRQSGLRLMIGPEGGFSEEERGELASRGFEEVSLGNAVLRVETAVVAALALARVIRIAASE